MKNEIQTLIPTTLDEWFRFAELVASTGLCPKDMRGKPADVLVAMQLGVGIGMAPLQAIQSIAVINGRPTLWGDAMLALVKQSGALVSILEELSSDNSVATCTVMREGEPEPVVRTFTTAQAQKAGLAKKPGPWSQYPDRMLQLKARNLALRDVFPDVLAGMYMREDIREIPPERDVTPTEDVMARLQGSVPEVVQTPVDEAKAPTAPVETVPAPPADDYITTTMDTEEFLREIALAESVAALKVIGKALQACTFETKEDHARLQAAYGARAGHLEGAMAGVEQ
jgi:hypothetical protein